MKTPSLSTKSGKLTAYAFACGYIQRKSIALVDTTIWMECGIYHIRRTDFNNTPAKRVFWETAKTLNGARKIFNS